MVAERMPFLIPLSAMYRFSSVVISQISGPVPMGTFMALIYTPTVFIPFPAAKNTDIEIVEKVVPTNLIF
jgi:hypothetical protein